MIQALYHVPRSQVWVGSRGRQSGKVHLHVDGGRSLCGRRGWYERPADPGEERCPRCVLKAEKLELAWPDGENFDYLGPDPNDMDGEKWGSASRVTR